MNFLSTTEKTMNNKEVLKSLESLSDVSIEDILEAMEIVGVSTIDGVKELPANVGQTIEITDDTGDKYYFGLSKFGFVEAVRKGPLPGKLVYVPNDDGIAP